MSGHEAASAAVAVRTIADAQVGFGHLRRCLTLAGELRSRGARVTFWIDGEPIAASLATSAGFSAHLMAGPEPAATAALIQSHRVRRMIVDSYQLQAGWFTAWRDQLDCLACVDDVADRTLDVDVVVNSSPTAATLPYRTAADCRLLLGPDYALIRGAFRRRAPRATPERVRRVLLTLGGADPHGYTAAVLGVVRKALPAADIDVAVGPLFGAALGLDNEARQSGRVVLHRGLQDLAPLMEQADLAVSGGGTTLFELAASGVPAVALCLAGNQEANIAALAAVPTLLPGGQPIEEGPAPRWLELHSALARLDADPGLRRAMGLAGPALIDCRGGERVAGTILDFQRSSR